jgi:hypothetical protein
LKATAFQWAFFISRGKKHMSEMLQEYVDSGSHRLRVDRAAGVIRGVKLLGLTSRNGRRYREDALIDAVGLYEGAKVNINHPKGHPLSPRDYQDRLGVVRSVQFRSGDGLFGDLHFNPKHALSEQLVWDAEHAPQNVGMSHNVLARTTRNGDETVVEAITKVQSIDLVADPATTSGLYEHSVAAGGSPADSTTDEPPVAAISTLTLEQLRCHRPDLISEVERAYESQLERVHTQLEAMIAKEGAQRRRERILQLLREHELPLPSSDGNGDSYLVSPQFLEMLMHAADEETVRQLIEERADLVRSACQWNGQPRGPASRRPRSLDQMSLAQRTSGGRIQTAAQFAAAVRSSM